MDTKSQGYLASLFCGVNIGQKPSFTWSEGLPAIGDDEWGMRQNRADIDFENLERALTLLLGELAGLTVDSDIFRGELPTEGSNGFMMRIAGIAATKIPRLISFAAICRGCHSERAAQLTAIARLTGKLPLPAILTVAASTIDTPVTFLALSMSQPAIFSTGHDGGQACAFCELNLDAQIMLRCH